MFDDTEEHQINLRSLGSSFIGHIPDTILFNTIAFLGVMNFFALLLHMLYAFAISMAIEIVLCLLKVPGRLTERYQKQIMG